MLRNLFVGLGLAMLAIPFAIAAPVPSEFNAKVAVKNYFLTLDKGFGDSDPLFVPPAQDVIAELGKYLESDNDLHRSHAVSCIWCVGKLSKDTPARALAVQLLLAYSTSANPDGSKARQALPRLLDFAKADFPAGATKQIEKFVRQASPDTEALLLAGLLDMKTVIEDLQAITSTKPGAHRFATPHWPAHLALARLGNKDAIKVCIETIEGEPDVVQRTRHFQELIYIRDPAGLDVLKKYLASDERLP